MWTTFTPDLEKYEDLLYSGHALVAREDDQPF